MGDISRILALIAALLCLPVAESAASASFAAGPAVLDPAPTERGVALGTTGVRDALQGAWPTEALGRLRAQVEKGGGVLLVGHTDPVGPRSLNSALGLQLAAEAGRQLARTLGVDVSRLACASVGEDSAGPPAVAAYAWVPPEPPRGGARVALLEPAGSGAAVGRLWGFWDPEGTLPLWVVSASDGEVVWEADPRRVPLAVRFPPRAARAALGVAFPGAEPAVAVSEQARAPENLSLGLRIDAQQAWSARLSGRIPPGWTDAVVWASGVPYPVEPGPEQRFEADVALLPAGNAAYLQAVDLLGRLAVGPAVTLPDGEGDAPDLLAVLVWEVGQADLDLHAWSFDRHTHPQDPDAAFSRTAVPGARLLFDGDGGRPASALWARGVEELDLEAQCYSDLGGEGARAWLYVLSYPGDPLRARRRILGPRHLSGRPIEVRWPALAWKGD